jgi:SAM-dependent methyltransferase
MSRIIDKITKNDLMEYLQKCSKVVDFDIEKAYNTTINFSKKHDGKDVPYESIIEMISLETKWYNSLSINKPDYSVYSSPYYFCEVWLCWSKYSRRYLKEIQSSRSLFVKSICDDMQNVKTVLDLGCGFGYTTASLKEIFNDANVIGTNIAESSQFKLANELGNSHNFKVIEDYSGIKSDLIFASEYFEHFQSPVEHLVDVLDACNPRYMIIANTFNSSAIGHFNEYYHHNNAYTGKQIGKLFNETMRNKGYQQVKTKCWNNRPSYWKKMEVTLEKYF